MDLNLQSKTAFISGSTQGIGFAIALQLLKEGAKVIINGRQQDKTKAAEKTLKEAVPQGKVSGIAADFSDKKAVDQLLDEIEQVDILVNNVGQFEQKEFNEITDADWEAIFELNVLSGIRLSRYFLPKMQTKNWGRIIFISSESGLNIPGDMIHYGTTKSAMMAVSNGLAKLTKNSEVTVNTILGGPTYSDGVARTVTQIAHTQNLSVDEMKALIIQKTNPQSLLQRFIAPSEIATLAVYLASPLSIAINGACLRADGGVLQTMI